MDLSAGTLLASLLVSSIGLGFFLYGKKEVRFPQLVAGLVLMIYPYFVAGPLVMWSVAGLVLLTLAAALRLDL